MERTPTLEHELLSRMKNFLVSIDFVYRIRKAPPRIGWRGRPTRERGPNENIFIVLVPAPPRKANNHPCFAQEDMTNRFPPPKQVESGCSTLLAPFAKWWGF